MTRSIEFGSDARYKEATRSFLEESLSCMKQQKLLPNTNSVSRAQMRQRFSTEGRSISSVADYSDMRTRAQTTAQTNLRPVFTKNPLNWRNNGTVRIGSNANNNVNIDILGGASAI